jgi:MFS family permease
VTVADHTGWRPLRRPDHPRGPSPFSRLAAAHALSVAGDTLVTVALAGSLFFNISPTAARGKVTLSLLVTMAPFAVIAPLLGPALDRVQGGRRLMVVAAALGRAFTCLAMAEVVNGLWLFPAAFAALVFSKAHAVAKSSLVPASVESEDRLVEANAKLALTAGVVGFVAAGPAVAILKVWGAAWVLRVDFAVFLAGAVASLRIAAARTEEPGRQPEEGRAQLHDAGVRLAATSMAVLRGAVGFTTFLVAFSFRRAHAPSWWFGVVLATSMVGTLVGAALAPRLRERIHEETIITACLGVLAATALLAARLHTSRPVIALFTGAVGVAASAGKLAFDSLVQRDAPAAVQGRAFARFETEFQLVWVVGALLPVVLAVPDRVGFFVLAVGPALAALSYLSGRRALRGRRRLPASGENPVS